MLQKLFNSLKANVFVLQLHYLVLFSMLEKTFSYTYNVKEYFLFRIRRVKNKVHSMQRHQSFTCIGEKKEIKYFELVLVHQANYFGFSMVQKFYNLLQ